MTATITLTLPDKLLRPLERLAHATHQPVEALVLSALQASLPSLDGLPPELQAELTRLEELSTAQLWAVLTEVVPAETQTEIESLLEANRAGTLNETDRLRLNTLQHQAEGVMLRKARAAVILRFRGQRLPTLAELRQQTFPAA